MYKIFYKYLVICILGLFTYNTVAQTLTIGLLHSETNVSDGYTLFTPANNENTYLINNCGEKINEWIFTEKPGATCYFLENGNLLRAGKNSIEIRDWDNNLLWIYSTSDNDIAQHHDIEPLPNGNILCVVRNTFSVEEMTAQGRDPNTIGDYFKLDRIVELQPIGENKANIVWEWRFMDHFIQDFDETKSNYGIILEHPELLDLNFDNNNTVDFTHVNAVDYNSVLDQIIITARNLSEFYIIDHSTTTEEAAGHTGGNSNAGGDILWRWGNPQVYQRGGIEDQKLFLPHDSKWVEPGYVDEGKITAFNNVGDGSGDFSSVNMITPELVDGNYLKEDNKFLPMDFEWSWNGMILDDTVNEPIKSGVHGLPNGNFIIAESSWGRVSEITKSGEHLWSYRNPSGFGIYNQFEEFNLGENSIFRAEKYPSDFIGFAGKDLSSKGIIEDENSNSVACILISDISNPESDLLSIVNPIHGNTLHFNQNVTLQNITITDLNGRVAFKHGYFNGSNLGLKLKPNIYILKLLSEGKVETRKIIVK